jgi:hypothetical protein
LTPRQFALWRSAAAIVWIISLFCLFKAIGDGTVAEEALYNPHFTDVDRVAIHHLSAIADIWSTVGWTLQLATAAVLCSAIFAKTMVRRIFQSLGILIAADGVTLLLAAIIIR